MIIRDLNSMEKSKCPLVLGEKYPDIKARLERLEIMKRSLATGRGMTALRAICGFCVFFYCVTEIAFVAESMFAFLLIITIFIALSGILYWWIMRDSRKYKEERLEHEANLEKLLRDHPNLEEKGQDINAQAILEEVAYFEKKYSSDKIGRQKSIAIYTYFIIYAPYRFIINILVHNASLDRNSFLNGGMNIVFQIVLLCLLCFFEVLCFVYKKIKLLLIKLI